MSRAALLRTRRSERRNKRRIDPVERETLTGALIEEAYQLAALVDEIIEADDARHLAPAESATRTRAAMVGLRRIRAGGTL